MNPLQFLDDFVQKGKNVAQAAATGFQEADLIQLERIKKAKELRQQTGENVSYGESVFGPGFKKELKERGISARETPVKFAGAYASRALIDVANDGTRTYWWRWNHPLAIAQKVVQLGVTPQLIESPSARAAVALGIGVPALASTGVFDITNPEEEFRPKGYAQRYAPEGAEDRRQTGQPVQEIFERFFLQRTGDPLKYATAKEEIPDLTPERYGNYLNFLYQDKGLLGLGIVKATPENLQGYPEARVLGFPVTIPMAAGFTAGAAGANLAARTGTTPRQRAVRGAIGGILGSLGGITAGNIANEMIAAGNRPQLPTTAEYGVTTGKI